MPSNHLTTRSHFCAVSLPRSLSSATASTADSCRNAHRFSLLPPGKGVPTTAGFLPLWAEPHGEFLTAGQHTGLLSAFLPFCLPSWPTVRCFNARISHVCLCRESLLSYSSSDCSNFKGRNQGGLSPPFLWHHSRKSTFLFTYTMTNLKTKWKTLFICIVYAKEPSIHV